ncbi:FecR family protein [bacterium A37T11]|nr:FecR family protein [bacterium A37T11]
MNEQEIREILARYVAGTSTAAEKELVDSWFDRYYNQRMQDGPTLPDPENLASEVWTRLQAQQVPAPRQLSKYYRYLPYAAILLVALATTLYFYSSLIVNHKSNIVNDIAPGYNQATLTLADGRKVALDSAQSGIIVNTEAITYDNGRKVEGLRPKVEGEEVRQLVLSTPKGGQYQIILSDGTKVWLNAASTLKYPSRFSGNRREVTLEGEAFFEVNTGDVGANKYSPFIVKSKNQEILVLGTSFNVTAFTDEKETKTTLITGKVQVKAQNLKLKTYNLQLLSPAQQALVKGDSLTVSKVDVASTIAWKNHEFNFNNTPLKDIMRQLERWYNVEVVHIDQLPDKNFYGQMSRDVKLSQVLAMIRETSHLTFIIEGRRLIYQAEK